MRDSSAMLVYCLPHCCATSSKLFALVFTSTGEGSCFDSTSSSCAYSQYCAYHANFGSTTTPTIYANMPYANPTYCYDPPAGQHDPNGDIPSDANVNITSHEITEATTDPLVSTGPYGWYDTANGEEIGDLCAWTFAPLTGILVMPTRAGTATTMTCKWSTTTT